MKHLLTILKGCKQFNIPFPNTNDDLEVIECAKELQFLWLIDIKNKLTKPIN